MAGRWPLMTIHAGSPLSDPMVALRDAMDSCGVKFSGVVIADGKLHRVYLDGHRKGSKNGWYVAHEDAPASASFGDYKSGVHETWTVEKPDRMTDADREAIRARMADTRRQRAEEQAAAHALCREAAAAIVAAVEPASPEHPYLVRKGLVVTPGLKQLARDVKYTVADSEQPNRTARKGVLVIPIKGPDGVLHGVQTIGPDGRKHFLSGTNKAGHYFSIGKLTQRIIIAEGFSTCSTIHSATGLCVVIAFDAGNLKAVARAIRSKYPTHEIVIGADNDRFTLKPVPNPGMTKACEAAAEVDGMVAWPESDPGVMLASGGAPTDFNDLAEIRGNLESVAAAFDAAMRPHDIENHADPRRSVETPLPAGIVVVEPAKPALATGQHDMDFPGDWPAGYKPPVRFANVPDKTPSVWSRKFAEAAYGHADHVRIARYKGEWLSWRKGAWTAVSDDEVKGAAYAWGEVVQVEDLKTGELLPMRPDRRKIGDLMDALRGQVVIPDHVEMPGLIGRLDVDPRYALPVSNGILDLRSRRLLPASPHLFVGSATDVEYLPRATPPSRWLQFLHEVWPDDRDAVATLQEFFGLALSSDTSFQKLLLIVGPRRSGKGTIARVLGAIVGEGAICSPTLTSLSQPFGLAPLIGRRVALVTDARLSGRADLAQIAERLLSITGEDLQTVDRKHLPMWTGNLSTRFMIFSNEAPALRDASGALAGRFVSLRMSRTFFGREDRALFAALQRELPGILNWALEGLERLADRGRFLQPKSSDELVDSIARTSSPVATFLDDECIVERTANTGCDDLFYAWSKWCDRQGLKPGSSPNLSRDLSTIIADLKVARPRSDADRKRVYVGVRLRH
jgi:putative DNA primase/helicase